MKVLAGKKKFVLKIPEGVSAFERLESVFLEQSVQSVIKNGKSRCFLFQCPHQLPAGKTIQCPTCFAWFCSLACLKKHQDRSTVRKGEKEFGNPVKFRKKIDDIMKMKIPNEEEDIVILSSILKEFKRNNPTLTQSYPAIHQFLVSKTKFIMASFLSVRLRRQKIIFYYQTLLQFHVRIYQSFRLKAEDEKRTRESSMMFEELLKEEKKVAELRRSRPPTGQHAGKNRSRSHKRRKKSRNRRKKRRNHPREERLSNSFGCLDKKKSRRSGGEKTKTKGNSGNVPSSVSLDEVHDLANESITSDGDVFSTTSSITEETRNSFGELYNNDENCFGEGYWNVKGRDRRNSDPPEPIWYGTKVMDLIPNQKGPRKAQTEPAKDLTQGTKSPGPRDGDKMELDGNNIPSPIKSNSGMDDMVLSPVDNDFDLKEEILKLRSQVVSLQSQLSNEKKKVEILQKKVET